MKLAVVAAIAALLSAGTAFAAGPAIPPQGANVPREISWPASRPS